MTKNLPVKPQPASDLVFYQTEDGQIRIQVRLEHETVWLTQKTMAELFQTTIPNINQHIKNIYTEGELSPESTIKKYLIVQTEGDRQIKRTLDYYNLDMILAVGYRVNSIRGTQFRIWATQRLREYIVKGFTIEALAQMVHFYLNLCNRFFYRCNHFSAGCRKYQMRVELQGEK
jgi:hypothetical protein